MSGAITTALAGLQAAAGRVNVRAGNIVNAQSENFTPLVPVQSAGPGGPRLDVRQGPQLSFTQADPGRAGFQVSLIDLPREITDLTLASNAYEASARVLGRLNDMERTTLDLI